MIYISSYLMLVSGKKILEKARRGKYAVPAFNINNMEILQAIIDGCVELKSPVILQTSENAVDYAGMDYLVAMVQVAAKAKIPICLHLDQGKDLKKIKQAIKSGYTSIMIDGSDLSLKENIKLSKKVVAWAHKAEISVEAELGAIKGLDNHSHLTNPDQVTEFVDKTNCDYLAIAIGTAYGAYKYKLNPKLDIKRLEEIKKQVKIPLVLHGASTVPEDFIAYADQYGACLHQAKGNDEREIKRAVKAGINKVNIDTDLRLAFDAGVREILYNHCDIYDPRKILGNAKVLMTRVVKRKIKLLGSQGKA